MFILPSLADFVVWDNDNIYALVTIVSLAFTALLIFVVMQRSRSSDKRLQQRRMAAASEAVSETDDNALSIPTPTESNR